MRHGDAARIAQMCSQFGMPLEPWQRQLLDRSEQQDIDAQFAEIAKEFKR